MPDGMKKLQFSTINDKSYDASIDYEPLTTGRL